MSEFQAAVLTWAAFATLFLGAGLIAAFFRRRRAAAAHAALFLALIAVLSIPLFRWTVRCVGIGLLPPDSTMSRVSPSAVAAPFPVAAGIPAVSGAAATNDASKVRLKPSGAKDRLPAIPPATLAADSQALWQLPWFLWAALSLLAIARLGRNLIAGVRLRRESLPCSDPILVEALNAARHLVGRNRQVYLRRSDSVRCPMICCWGTPCVLVPTQRPANVDWHAVMVHELAHVRRNDHWSALTAEIVCCVFPWHPLAWIARRQLSDAAERACDDWAVQHAVSQAGYADSLVAFAVPRTAMLLAPAVVSTTGVAARVARVLAGRCESAKLGRATAFATVAVALAAAAAASLAQPAEPQPPADAPEAIRDLLEHWRRTADAPNRGKLWDQAISLGKSKDPRIIPAMIGVIDADNSYDTVYGVGYFGLGSITGVDYSPYHDGSWWRRWWDGNKARFPTAAATQIPDLPKSPAGKAHKPFPQDLDALEGKTRWLMKEFELLRNGKLDTLGLSDIAGEIAKHKDPRAIPTLIGVIDADNSYDTIYGVGYFGLKPITGVGYSPYHDGAWWRRWWKANNKKFPDTAQAVPIPDLAKTARGQAYVPMPESFETFEGKIAWFLDALKAGRDVALDDFGRALASHKDPRAIPFLIGLIDADNTERTIYYVGHFALGELTDVKFDKAHDGAWWRGWWAQHQKDFPAAAQQTPIPDLKGAFSTWVRSNKAREQARLDAEFDGFPCQDLRAGGDERKRYFLLGPAASQKMPERGWRLLLILPGGAGDADFLPFCRRIHRNALPDGFIAAELVAPAWSDNPNRTVWPTSKLKDDKALFTTEELIRAVVDDVARRHSIDRRQVLALGWSSSGPALYCDSLQSDSPVTGWFVAMSVFRPQWMPDLAAAKNRRYYLLHSPDDKLIPIEQHARTAAKRLRDAGATVKLTEYAGGHGWTEDPLGHIRRGIDWLATERPKE